MDEQRKKALAQALGQIEKQFGKGAVMRMGDGGVIRDIEVVSTGSIGLDVALGVGGLPKGRVIEIYGPESSGKTTLTLQVIAEAQKQGGTAAFVDAEHALDPAYAEKLGVNVDELLVSQPDTGEQALEIVTCWCARSAVDVVVIDSVAALTPKAEIEGEMGDSHMGLQARLMSQALRKLTANMKQVKYCCVIFINQIRMKIGVMFGSPETTTGGNALKFYSSVRLDIRRIGAIKQGDEVIGNQTRVKVVKNKVAPPFKQAEFEICTARVSHAYGGDCRPGCQNGIVDKAGSWYSYGEDRIGQGTENAAVPGSTLIWLRTSKRNSRQTAAQNGEGACCRGRRQGRRKGSRKGSRQSRRRQGRGEGSLSCSLFTKKSAIFLATTQKKIAFRAPKPSARKRWIFWPAGNTGRQSSFASGRQGLPGCRG